MLSVTNFMHRKVVSRRLFLTALGIPSLPIQETALTQYYPIVLNKLRELLLFYQIHHQLYKNNLIHLMVAILCHFFQIAIPKNFSSKLFLILEFHRLCQYLQDD